MRVLIAVINLSKPQKHMDVYDLAEWSCPAALSSISIAHGSAPVAVPDFTRGAWKRIDGYKFAYAE